MSYKQLFSSNATQEIAGAQKKVGPGDVCRGLVAFVLEQQLCCVAETLWAEACAMRIALLFLVECGSYGDTGSWGLRGATKEFDE
jgi:hypothetical protein